MTVAELVKLRGLGMVLSTSSDCVHSIVLLLDFCFLFLQCKALMLLKILMQQDAPESGALMRMPSRIPQVVSSSQLRHDVSGARMPGSGARSSPNFAVINLLIASTSISKTVLSNRRIAICITQLLTKQLGKKWATPPPKFPF